MEDYFNPLDGMLEVVMEEPDEDEPPINTDFSLPPVPTFDLDAQRYTYNPIPKPKPSPPIAPKAKATPPSVSRRAAKPPSASINASPEYPFSLVYDKPTIAYSVENVCLEEENFLNATFRDLMLIEKQRIHCTMCDRHIGTFAQDEEINEHKLLKVLVCSQCKAYYGSGTSFPKDEQDNTEIYCGWCGEGGQLVCCSFCPKVFCKKCIRRNFSAEYWSGIERASDWACFCCAPKPLWPLRALCRAVIKYYGLYGKTVQYDKSTCCGDKTPKPRRKSPPRRVLVEKPAAQTPPRPMIVFNPSHPLPRLPNIIRPPRMPPARILPKPLRPTPPPPPLTPAPRPTTSPMPRSSIPPRVPEVIVDHATQDNTLVRIRTGTREQFIRVIIKGTCQRMPNFPANPSFTLTSLQHAFRLNRIVFDKFKMLKDKIEKNAGKGDGNPSDLEAEAKSVQTMLTHWKQLISDIESDLSSNLSIYKSQQKKKEDDDVVIDLSDEEDDSPPKVMSWKFPTTCKDTSFGIESDCEIISDDEDTPASSAGKRKSDDKNESSRNKVARVESGMSNGVAQKDNGANNDDDDDDYDKADTDVDEENDADKTRRENETADDNVSTDVDDDNKSDDGSSKDVGKDDPLKNVEKIASSDINGEEKTSEGDKEAKSQEECDEDPLKSDSTLTCETNENNDDKIDDSNENNDTISEEDPADKNDADTTQEDDVMSVDGTDDAQKAAKSDGDEKSDSNNDESRNKDDNENVSDVRKVVNEKPSSSPCRTEEATPMDEDEPSTKEIVSENPKTDETNKESEAKSDVKETVGNEDVDDDEFDPFVDPHRIPDDVLALEEALQQAAAGIVDAGKDNDEEINDKVKSEVEKEKSLVSDSETKNSETVVEKEPIER